MNIIWLQTLIRFVLSLTVWQRTHLSQIRKYNILLTLLRMKQTPCINHEKLHPKKCCTTTTAQKQLVRCPPFFYKLQKSLHPWKGGNVRIQRMDQWGDSHPYRFISDFSRKIPRTSSFWTSWCKEQHSRSRWRLRKTITENYLLAKIRRGCVFVVKYPFLIFFLVIL